MSFRHYVLAPFLTSSIIKTLQTPAGKRLAFQTLQKAHRESQGAFFRDEDLRFMGFLTENGSESRSQMFQDLWVLYETGFKRDGYFVEFGASDGMRINNTYLLEKKYGWNGILAEPAPIWHQDLAKNRDCQISHKCVWNKTGEVISFDQTSEAEYSTISDYVNVDCNAYMRKKGETTTINVDTVSLNDLLDEMNAPNVIDFISMDTEGSEFAILESFDFQRYDVRYFCIEHNYSEWYPRIDALMRSKGYEERFSSYSNQDAWYRKTVGDSY